MNRPDPSPRAAIVDRTIRLMLVWYEYNEGTHIILANTEAALVRAFVLRCEAERTLIECKGVYRIETGPPPPSFLRALRRRNAARIKADFKSWICCLLKMLLDKGTAAPQGVGPCPGYVPRGPPEERDPEDWTVTSHFRCANCGGEKFVLQDGWTWDRLYGVAADIWLDRSPIINHDKRTPYRRGVEPLPVEDLKVAIYNPGHHSSGIELHDVEQTANRFMRGRDRQIHFFYRVLATLDVPVAISDYAAGWEAACEKQKLDGSKRHAEAKRQDALRIKRNVFDVFARAKS